MGGLNVTLVPFWLKCDLQFTTHPPYILALLMRGRTFALVQDISLQPDSTCLTLRCCAADTLLGPAATPFAGAMAASVGQDALPGFPAVLTAAFAAVFTAAHQCA